MKIRGPLRVSADRALASRHACTWVVSNFSRTPALPKLRALPERTPRPARPVPSHEARERQREQGGAGGCGLPSVLGALRGAACRSPRDGVARRTRETPVTRRTRRRFLGHPRDRDGDTGSGSKAMDEVRTTSIEEQVMRAARSYLYGHPLAWDMRDSRNGSHTTARLRSQARRAAAALACALSRVRPAERGRRRPAPAADTRPSGGRTPAARGPRSRSRPDGRVRPWPPDRPRGWWLRHGRHGRQSRLVGRGGLRDRVPHPARAAAELPLACAR